MVYKSSLEKLVERANGLLPKLRRASIPYWRLDYLIRQKKQLTPEELAERLETHNKKTELDLGNERIAG